MSTVITSATSLSSSSEKRKRLRLKCIVVSEHSYLALKRSEQASDSFNDVVSKLLRIHSINQEKKRQQQLKRQQHNTDDQNNNFIRSEPPFRVNVSELFDEQEGQQLAS
jgi:predicted CopG family antitoxin